MKILAVFYYPLLYYPLLVCCTLQHRAGYAFGSLLALSHFGVLFWQKVDCPETTEVRSLWRSIVQGSLAQSSPRLCIASPVFRFFEILPLSLYPLLSSPQIYTYYALLASLPQLACLAYLCFQFPLLFFKGPKTDEVGH